MKRFLSFALSHAPPLYSTFWTLQAFHDAVLGEDSSLFLVSSSRTKPSPCTAVSDDSTPVDVSAVGKSTRPRRPVTRRSGRRLTLAEATKQQQQHRRVTRSSVTTTCPEVEEEVKVSDNESDDDWKQEENEMEEAGKEKGKVCGGSGFVTAAAAATISKEAQQRCREALRRSMARRMRVCVSAPCQLAAFSVTVERLKQLLLTPCPVTKRTGKNAVANDGDGASDPNDTDLNGDLEQGFGASFVPLPSISEVECTDLHDFVVEYVASVLLAGLKGVIVEKEDGENKSKSDVTIATGAFTRGSKNLVRSISLTPKSPVRRGVGARKRKRSSDNLRREKEEKENLTPSPVSAPLLLTPLLLGRSLPKMLNLLRHLFSAVLQRVRQNEGHMSSSYVDDVWLLLMQLRRKAGKWLRGNLSCDGRRSSSATNKKLGLLLEHLERFDLFLLRNLRRQKDGTAKNCLGLGLKTASAILAHFSDVVPASLDSSSMTHSEPRSRSKRSRLRSRNPIVDNWLALENYDDGFADLEDFIGNSEDEMMVENSSSGGELLM